MNTLSKTAIQRLTTLATFMESAVVPPNDQFDMGAWCEYIKPNMVSRFFGAQCGTRACAAGWATTIGSFAARGFKLDDEGDPSYRGYDGYDAVSRFFEIDDDLCWRLFGSELVKTVHTPQEWAVHCWQVLEEFGVFPESGAFNRLELA